MIRRESLGCSHRSALGSRDAFRWGPRPLHPFILFFLALFFFFFFYLRMFWAHPGYPATPESATLRRKGPVAAGRSSKAKPRAPGGGSGGRRFWAFSAVPSFFKSRPFAVLKLRWPCTAGPAGLALPLPCLAPVPASGRMGLLSVLQTLGAYLLDRAWLTVNDFCGLWMLLRSRGAPPRKGDAVPAQVSATPGSEGSQARGTSVLGRWGEASGVQLGAAPPSLPQRAPVSGSPPSLCPVSISRSEALVVSL